jgi:hypothetical protein
VGIAILATRLASRVSANARPNNIRVSSSKIAGHDNAVVGSIVQQGRNNLAQNGNNNTTTINDIPPERRIKPEDTTIVIPMLTANRSQEGD